MFFSWGLEQMEEPELKVCHCRGSVPADPFARGVSGHERGTSPHVWGRGKTEKLERNSANRESALGVLRTAYLAK